jgi:hypothetical protein
MGLAGGMAMSPAYVAYNRPEAAPPTRANSTSASISPASTIDSRDGRTEGRKKRNILGAMKLKERSQSYEPVVTSPLPLKPLTPKVARVLGLPLEEGNDDLKERTSEDTTDSGDEIMQVRPKIHRKSSLQWLSSNKIYTEKQTKSNQKDKDEFSMLITPSTPGFLKKIDWKGSGKKAKHMLDLMQPHAMSSKQGLVPGTLPRLSHEDRRGTVIGYNSDSDIIAPRRVAPRQIAVQKRRSRIRKKNPKFLERMSPITEASLSEDGYGVDGDGDSTALEAISEDERQTYASEEADHSLNEDDETAYAFQLSLNQDADNESDEELEDKAPASELSCRETTNVQRLVHPGTIYVKSPLQDLESMYMDNMEKKNTMDYENEQLYQSNVSMKRELRNIKARTLFQGAPRHKFVYNHARDHLHDHGSEEGYGSHICSAIEDIPSDEEPGILKAPYMKFKRITPGMVKIVDIPPRKLRGIVNQGERSSSKINSPVSHKRGGAVLMGNVSIRELFKEYKDADLKRPNTTRARSSSEGFMDQTKARLPRQESNGQLQGSVDDYDYDYAGKPSFPKRIDPVVLAEQEKPSASFPRDAPATSPRQKRTRPVLRYKHQCVHNGHIFHQYNLRQTPDNIGINDLEVRPYFQIPTGVKQDISIPIRCQKCSFGVIDELWQCSVPVCRLAVCKHCAVEMEMEWQERAVKGWKRK